MTSDQWIALAVIVALWWLGRKFDRMPRPALNWDTQAEEAKEAAEFCAYRNRHNESHLRLVKGDSVREYEPYDSQAFALDATSHFGFYKPVSGGDNAA